MPTGLFDINNLGHVLGGAVFCWLALWYAHTRIKDWWPKLLAGLGVGIGINLLWEIAVDVLKLWPSMADPCGFDPLDPFFRAAFGAMIVCIIYLSKYY